MTLQQAEMARDAAAAALAPALVPVGQLMRAEVEKPLLPTGLPVIDAALGGGLLNGSITEIVGPSGAQSSFCGQWHPHLHT